jgi:HD-GYP domain-containing protein (c-di-GMP phosphodiesterase class II)
MKKNSFMLTVILAAMMLVAFEATRVSVCSPFSAALLLTVLTAVISEMYPLSLPRYGRLSLAEPLAIGAAYLHGALGTGAVVLAANLCRFLRKDTQKATSPLFFSYAVAQGLLCNCGIASLYHGFRPYFATDFIDKSVVDLALLGAATGVCYLMQSGIIAYSQYLQQDSRGHWSTRVNATRFRFALQVFLPIGMLAAVAQQESVLVYFLLLAPITVTYSSLRRYTETLREAREVVENLAQAVEKREPNTVGHSRRVEALASSIARELRLDEFSVGCVATAARLHELGKISVGDGILCKSGKLQESDWESVRRYPEVGAQVASRLSFSQREADLIRFHQEHFDGKGYYGVKGDLIPMGARILGAAKAFDAMISRRSYRPALSFGQALETLVSGSGHQFDPQVVRALSKCVSNVQLQAA